MDRRKSIRTLFFGAGAASLALQGFSTGIPGADGEAYDGGNPSLITRTPMEGRELAIELSRKSIAAIQTDPGARKKLRPNYAGDTTQLIATAQAIAIEFQVIAAANNYWK